MLNGKTVFLSGPITGDPDYKEKFNGAEEHCRMMGAKAVYNPARLPQGWEYDDYIACCLALVRKPVDVVLTLPGYLNSPGSAREVKEAYDRGIQVVKFEELERQVGE